jgi:L-amino acid N-acyltransferase YncA
MIHIRKAKPEDHDSIWQIIQEVIAGGDTYVFDPDSSREEMLQYWCGQDKHCYVAIIENIIVGTFFIKDNFQGLGSHVANASYMTLPSAFGKGIGRSMGEFSISEAKGLGYKAMQFNIVVRTNERAIRLWQKLGFEIKGEIPEAFNHLTEGYVDACIMWRKL